MNKFKSAKNDIKKTWQLLKNVIKRNRNQNSPTDRISEINSGDI